MDCATYELNLIDILEGTLSAEEATAATQHRETCAACHSATEDARRIRMAYAELPASDVGADVAAVLLAHAREPAANAPSTDASVAQRPEPARRVALLAAAAGLLLAALWQLTAEPANRAPTGLETNARVADLLRRGDAARDSGDAREARQSYGDALDLGGDSITRTTLHHRLAELHLVDEQADAALSELSHVLAGDTAYAHRDRALLQRAEALEVLGRVEEARAALEAFAVEFPEHSEAVEARIRGLDNARDYDLNDLRSLGYL